jgi:hypothetical protein
MQVDSFCQEICVSGNKIAVLHRLGDPDTYDGLRKNIKIYDKTTGELINSVGDTHLSNNWLVSRELSRGSMYCSAKDDLIYATNWYVPRLLTFSSVDSDFISKIWFENLKLMQLENTLNEHGLPRVIFRGGEGSAVINNVIVTDVDIFIQIYERPVSDIENTYTYQIDKNTLKVKRKFEEIGLIHQISDGKIVTSENVPHPKVVIYNHRF